MAFYNAVFYSEDQGYFKVVCRGYSKREYQPFSKHPTVLKKRQKNIPIMLILSGLSGFNSEMQ